MYPIEKLNFQDLAFFIPRNNLIKEIPKTIVFVDKIENAIQLKKYLSSRFLDSVYNRTQVFVIIKTFISNLHTTIRSKMIKNL